ncbi:hypothetical protein [Phycicoccus sonneratiae]|uniref:Uncharacterized protein n=1 Tax=Phycicoccus sonneratiae TaxID=2807628 RepID=A0ABS2CMB2_9MICO|nr:hypothetical protein [Phycicoccus sonneraticus]MBM6401007.1 hypothetical protein [Phycicoccus sonneraticus]
MADSHRSVRVDVDEPEDIRVYGIGWIGLLAAAAGVVIGVVRMFSEGESTLAGAATVAVSVAVGVLIYLVTKVLDRH